MLQGSKTAQVAEESIQREEREFYKRLSKPSKVVDGLKYAIEKHKDSCIGDGKGNTGSETKQSSTGESPGRNSKRRRSE